jgi:8-oxo-dGTP diphosphatase
MIGKRPLNRYTRYQGAIVRNHSILLIRQRENESGRSYWILPGGGIEPGETEEDCVRREMKEETNLDVRVV